jgi:hypothetical protein
MLTFEHGLFNNNLVFNKHVLKLALVLQLIFNFHLPIYFPTNNLKQRIWDKARCYWGHVENPLGT